MSKNINIDGNRNGIEKVELPLVGGGFGTFVDEDEINEVLEITENGAYNTKMCASVEVNVPPAEGEGYPAPEGTVNITENGDHNVAGKAIARVTVPTNELEALTNPAAAGDIASGKKAYSDQGSVIVGTNTDATTISSELARINAATGQSDSTLTAAITRLINAASSGNSGNTTGVYHTTVRYDEEPTGYMFSLDHNLNTSNVAVFAKAQNGSNFSDANKLMAMFAINLKGWLSDATVNFVSPSYSVPFSFNLGGLNDNQYFAGELNRSPDTSKTSVASNADIGASSGHFANPFSSSSTTNKAVIKTMAAAGYTPAVGVAYDVWVIALPERGVAE